MLPLSQMLPASQRYRQSALCHQHLDTLARAILDTKRSQPSLKSCSQWLKAGGVEYVTIFPPNRIRFILPHHPSSICSWDLPHKLAERKAGWIGSSHPKLNLRGVKSCLPTKFNCDIKGSFISIYMGLKDQRGILRTKFNTANIFIIIGSITNT